MTDSGEVNLARVDVLLSEGALTPCCVFVLVFYFYHFIFLYFLFSGLVVLVSHRVSSRGARSGRVGGRGVQDAARDGGAQRQARQGESRARAAPARRSRKGACACESSHRFFLGFFFSDHSLHAHSRLGCGFWFLQAEASGVVPGSMFAGAPGSALPFAPLSAVPSMHPSRVAALKHQPSSTSSSSSVPMVALPAPPNAADNAAAALALRQRLKSGAARYTSGVFLPRFCFWFFFFFCFLSFSLPLPLSHGSCFISVVCIFLTLCFSSLCPSFFSLSSFHSLLQRHTRHAAGQLALRRFDRLFLIALLLLLLLL